MVLSVITASIAVVILIAQISIAEFDENIHQKSQRDLIAKREAITTKIEKYFSTIEKQVQTLSANSQTQKAASDFINAFKLYTGEREKITDFELRQSLQDYYHKEFGKKFETVNGQMTEVEKLYKNLNATSNLLQFDFISNNPNKLGEKDALLVPKGNTTYAKIHQQHHRDFQFYLNQFGYYDIFIVDADSGNIVYSVFKELDFATNLINGPYANTGIAEAFRQAKSLPANQTYISDFTSYLPSYNAPASFIASPIQIDGQSKAILIFQMPLAEINNIMTHDSDWKNKGFGQSGETYLVGKDKTLRNESRFFVEDQSNYLNAISTMYPAQAKQIRAQNTTIGIQSVQGKASDEALKGNKGFTTLNDYRGVAVLSAYGPVHYGSHTWALLSEVDEAEAYAAIETLSQSIWWSATTVIAMLVIVTFVLAYWLSVILTRPIHKLADEVEKLNSGNADLNVVLKKSGITEIDKVTLGFNNFLSLLKQIIGSIKEHSESVASSSTQLNVTTELTNNAAYTQQAQSHEINEALKQFYLTIKEVAENSNQASSETSRAKDITEENSQRAHLAKGNINQLVNEVLHSADTLGQLKGQVESINEVLDVITAIAEQTNLLALNAAIEAARAGEHGRGFAVVADEVRLLATRTQQSTVEIQENINSLTVVAGAAVDSMQRASASAEGGIHLVDELSTSLNELLLGIQDLDNINLTVASANEEQKYTCDEIMKNMTKVEQSASELFVASKDVSSASVALSGIASGLQGQVCQFK